MIMDQIDSLRSALEYLKGIPGEYAETDEPVDPYGEIAGVYRYIGAQGTIMRPTKTGPAIVFNNIKGFPGQRCAIGVLGSRGRIAKLLGVEEKGITQAFTRASLKPLAPVLVPGEKALCREAVHLADEPGFDIRKLIMVNQNAPDDAGPFITMGIVRAKDPETGEPDVTIHRMALLGKDELSILAYPGSRHIGDFHKKAEERGEPLDVTINIGNDPAVSIGTCFSPPATPYGYDELGAAGALRGKPVELVSALTVDGTAIANSEFVIEGRIMPNTRVKEDRETGTGNSMAEFGGYTGPALMAPLIKVSAVTHRKDPIVQICVGCSDEHVAMAGIPAAASVLNLCGKALPGRVVDCFFPSSGGGKYMAVLQIRKSSEGDDGEHINAALMALSAYRELKHVILVDEDVDIYDLSDVMWAMNTRFQADRDLIMIPGAMGHPADPTADPAESPFVYTRGITCKAIFDCTVRYASKKRFERSGFMELDYKKWFPGL
ncbi:MAG: UbiD family decarboxylase [Clostridiales bacterium]|nr:UbiD family decarboxylase [Clostridiales bacterium]